MNLQLLLKPSVLGKFVNASLLYAVMYTNGAEVQSLVIKTRSISNKLLLSR